MNTSLRWIIAAACLVGSSVSALADPATTDPSTSTAALTTSSAKERYIPAKVWKVPEGNDYANPESEYSTHRMAESDNVVVFWAKEFGAEPAANEDPAKRFDVNDLLAECERFYSAYVNELKFVEKGKSVTDRYKVLIYIFGGKDGTAYGGGEDKKIGILWAPPARINKRPYGALAHELGHSFQYLVHADGAWGFTSRPKGGGGHSLFEMTSQYMLWQVYPEWMTFENYHLVSYLQKTHFAFLHETNMYHSPYVLEYWSGKHGVSFVGRLWREAQAGEDAVAAYKRLTGIDQATFNDEMFDAARRFITWDLPRVEQVARRYANQHTTVLRSLPDGGYQIDESRCPQNYGYNGIPLAFRITGTKVTLQFKGVAGAEGFRSLQLDHAGWRYGFVAMKADGTRVYSEVGSKPADELTFTVPDGTEHLWLVVMGAPTEHTPHTADGKDADDAQWPYQFTLTGAAVHSTATVR